MRPSRDEWLMSVAKLTASRSTCLRRSVGCVMINKRGHIIATGYNGVASGMKHCNEAQIISTSTSEHRQFPHACHGATSPSGTNLDGCHALHAEQNALLQCRDVYSIDTCFVTASPCMTCVKLLMNTSCQRIVFAEKYPHNEAEKLWTSIGRVWQHIPG